MLLAQNVIYANTEQRPLRLDVYGTRSQKNKAVVLYLHGGAWLMGGKEIPWKNNVLDKLLKQGMSVVSAEYRFSTEAVYPAPLNDVKQVVTWIMEHSTEFGFDPTKIGLLGYSAGAHLGVLMTAQQPQMIQAMVVVACPSDFLRLEGDLAADDSPVSMLIGQPVLKDRLAAALASPVHQIKNKMPPTLIIHGCDDEVVPIEQARFLEEALKAAATDVELIEVPRGGHALEPKNLPLVSDLMFPEHIQKKITEFFASHLA